MLWSKVTAVRFAVRGTDKADSFLKVFEMEEIEGHNKAAFADSASVSKKNAAVRPPAAAAGGSKFDRKDFPGF